jgi:hypothetical protein
VADHAGLIEKVPPAQLLGRQTIGGWKWLRERRDNACAEHQRSKSGSSFHPASSDFDAENVTPRSNQ